MAQGASARNDTPRAEPATSAARATLPVILSPASPMHVHFLGTGAAFSDAHRTTTMLAVESGGRLVVVDCGGDVVQRMMACGLDLDALDAVVLTHEHPDHVGGFALMIEKLWLSKRRRPLPLVGNAAALAQARRVWETYDTSGWDGLFDLDWQTIPDGEGPEGAGVSAWESEHLVVTALPVVHGPPTHGWRFEERESGKVAAYSCDTEPCDAVVRLAKDAHLLVHEATGAGKGHSSAEQAAEQAAKAGARLCVLVHLPPGACDDDLADARRAFPATTLAKEGGRVHV